MEKSKIKNRLQEHLESALAANPSIEDWFVIAVNGSWNYDLATPQSDVDSKLLVIPSFKNLIDGKTISYTHNIDNEIVDVKDFRKYFKVAMKQNINFMETFFAVEYIVNPKYQKYWDILIELRDCMAYSDPFATLNCAIGMMTQKMNQALSYSDTVLDDYDRKSVTHFYRLHDFVVDYGRSIVFNNNFCYEDCLLGDSQSNRILRRIQEGLDFFKNPKHLKNCLTEDFTDILSARTFVFGQFEKQKDGFKELQKACNAALDQLVKEMIEESLNINE